MRSVFDTLPGLEMPLGRISAALSRMWEGASEGGVLPSEFRASQLNLIVHFGLGIRPDEAAEIFQTIMNFSHRYPSRCIVLLPKDKATDETVMTAKIFGECFIGKSGIDRSCSEAVILGYPVEGKGFLENQVSILLDNDLPTYYWVCCFKHASNLADYSFFLNVARRVVYDSRRESPELSKIKWPRPDLARDLVYATLLPVRQSIGQFLSGFSPFELVSLLDTVEVAHSPGRAAEARCILRWLQDGFNLCARAAGCTIANVNFRVTPEPERDDTCVLRIRTAYADGRHFLWTARRNCTFAEISAKMGRGDINYPTSIKLLSPDAALAEAFFF